MTVGDSSCPTGNSGIIIGFPFSPAHNYMPSDVCDSAWASTVVSCVEYCVR